MNKTWYAYCDRSQDAYFEERKETFNANLDFWNMAMDWKKVMMIRLDSFESIGRLVFNIFNLWGYNFGINIIESVYFLGVWLSWKHGKQFDEQT